MVFQRFCRGRPSTNCQQYASKLPYSPCTVRNARAFLTVQGEYGSFDAYCWQFVDGRPRQNRWNTMRQIPATTRESDTFSRDLKRRGVSFVGSPRSDGPMPAEA